MLGRIKFKEIKILKSKPKNKAMIKLETGPAIATLRVPYSGHENYKD